MKRFLTSMVLAILLIPSLALGETVKFEDLIEREGRFYKKFTDIPFTGEVTGKKQGTLKDGKQEGPWVEYYDNGQLKGKATFKDGKPDGPVVIYRRNGLLLLRGTFKDGKREGSWVRYKRDGSVDEARTETYRNGEKVK